MLDTEKIINIARRAGEIAMEYRGHGEFSVESKFDESLVTQVDKEIDAFIRSELLALYPDSEVLSEENPYAVKDWSKKIWIVDPIDGTRSFVNGADGFSILIGMCDNGVPVFGLIYLPSIDELYVTEGDSVALYSKGEKSTINIQEKSSITNIKAIFAKSNAYISYPQLESSSVGWCMYSGGAGRTARDVLVGDSDIGFYPVPFLAKWDTCASDAILSLLGAGVYDMNLQKLDYTQDESTWGIHLIFGKESNVRIFLDELNSQK